MKQYHVVPLDLQLSEREGATDTVPAERLSGVVNDAARRGWEFVTIESIPYTVNPGCLAIFSGPITKFMHVIIFAKDVDSGAA